MSASAEATLQIHPVPPTPNLLDHHTSTQPSTDCYTDAHVQHAFFVCSHTQAVEGVCFAFSAHAVVTLDPVHVYHRIKGYSKYVKC